MKQLKNEGLTYLQILLLKKTGNLAYTFIYSNIEVYLFLIYPDQLPHLSIAQCWYSHHGFYLPSMHLLHF